MRAAVLTYHSHRVLGDDYATNDHVALASDLASLTKLGFEIVPLAAVVDIARGRVAGSGAPAVAITFDDRGRMFVVEYGDYPIGPPEGERPLSRVVLLDDTNGDGRADRRQVFADRLRSEHIYAAFAQHVADVVRATLP